MIFNPENKKPEIIYPCKWDYKIIGTNVDEMLKEIEIAAFGLEYQVKSSNVSEKGNYFSLNLTVLVPNEAVRDLIFQKLESSEFIKIVL